MVDNTSTARKKIGKGPPEIHLEGPLAYSPKEKLTAKDFTYQKK